MARPFVAVRPNSMGSEAVGSEENEAAVGISINAEDEGGRPVRAPAYVYCEMQRAARCGLHALNNILQAPTFSAAELNAFSEQVAAQVQGLARGAQVAENEFGGFGFEVLAAALGRFGIDLVNARKEEEEHYRRARAHPPPPPQRLLHPTSTHPRQTAALSNAIYQQPLR